MISRGAFKCLASNNSCPRGVRFHNTTSAQPEVLQILQHALNPHFPVRPDGAFYQWRKVPPRELSVCSGS